MLGLAHVVDVADVAKIEGGGGVVGGGLVPTEKGREGGVISF